MSHSKIQERVKLLATRKTRRTQTTRKLTIDYDAAGVTLLTFNTVFEDGSIIFFGSSPF